MSKFKPLSKQVLDNPPKTIGNQLQRVIQATTKLYIQHGTSIPIPWVLPHSIPVPRMDKKLSPHVLFIFFFLNNWVWLCHSQWQGLTRFQNIILLSSSCPFDIMVVEEKMLSYFYKLFYFRPFDPFRDDEDCKMLSCRFCPFGLLYLYSTTFYIKIN